MIQCDGQIEMSDYLKSNIKSGRVKDLTAGINSQGKAQYTQIGEVVIETYERYKDSPELVGRITNAVSVYVLTLHEISERRIGVIERTA